MSDLIERLRDGVRLRFNKTPIQDFITMCQQAADTIESQAKRIAELEASVLTQHMWMTERGHSLPPDSVKGLERYTELEAEVAALSGQEVP